MKREASIIRIKNLRLRTYIGFNQEEREKRQDVVINITLEYDGGRAANSDAVEDAVNYKPITKRVIKFVEENRFLLLEKLTQDVLALVLEDKQVQRATVEIDKPHALRFADSVSVCFTASQD